MSKISLNQAYYVSNKKLKLSDNVPGHQVLVTKISKNKKKVKVKTLTSLESPSKPGEKRKFKSTKRDLVEDLHEGRIIVIPKKDLNTPKLTGIFTKGIWINAKDLQKNHHPTKISKRYKRIIEK